MAAETMKFKLDGDDQEYEVPEVDDLDLDEWQVLYEYAGLTLDDFAPPARDDAGNLLDEEAEAERQRRLNQPAFTKALLHVGYQRSHPELKPAQVKGIVGKAKLLALLEQQLDQLREVAEAGDGEPEIPPASTSEPESESSASSLESDEKTNTKPDSSSSDSGTGSDEQAGLRAITGTGG